MLAPVASYSRMLLCEKQLREFAGDVQTGIMPPFTDGGVPNSGRTVVITLDS